MTAASAASGPGVSVVVPVYGDGAMLGELHRRLSIAMAAAGLDYELILVDDRGDVAAWGAIRLLAGAHRQVRGLRLGRNFGQHAATLCGIEAASGQWIVTMDDDLEHPPESIPALLAAGNETNRLVYGTFARRTHSRHRNLSSDAMRWALKRSFPDLNASYSSFRAMHRGLARDLLALRLSRPYIDGMLSWITDGVGTVELAHGERPHGQSGYTLPKLLSHATNIFVTYSRLPLRAATYSGVGLAMVSFVSLAWIIFGKVTGQITSTGYASLMSVVLFTCGIQLVILGVLGEYVGRLMNAAHHKPVYVVIART